MAKTQLNARVSDLTKQQLEELGSRWGTTQTETLTVIIDRMYRQETKIMTKVASEIITTDDLDKISPIDQCTEARKTTEPWQHGEWFAYEDDQWQHKGHYLWLPEAGRVGICTNGDSQWADADNVQHGLDMYVNDPDAYEAAN